MGNGVIRSLFQSSFSGFVYMVTRTFLGEVVPHFAGSGMKGRAVPNSFNGTRGKWGVLAVAARHHNLDLVFPDYLGTFTVEEFLDILKGVDTGVKIYNRALNALQFY